MKNRHIWEGLASFLVVGLGQIIKGDGKKGLVMILLFYLAVPSLIYLSLLLYAYLFLAMLGILIAAEIVLWGYNVWDAFTHEANI
ncbi:MAG: hypothetical protein PHH14_01610 [Candidatus Margulisbacteria bacterium]|nr:hypothetical protein [Candidatus Margulisiibacteriota bacterium]